MTIACIDAGQTKTDICLFNDEHEIICKQQYNPIIHPAKPGGLDSYRAIITELCKLLKSINFKEKLSICVSLSGYHGENEIIPSLIKEILEENEIVPLHLNIVPDYVGNWFSATNGDPGIIIISGGGTVVYGQNHDGISYRLGGWGHILGDEGSGYWIGLEALKASLKINAGLINPKSKLELSIKNFLNYSDEFELISWVNSGELSDKKIAQLVPIVNNLAEQGDQVSLEILDRAVEHLFNDLLVAIRNLGNLPVYLCGGVFNSKIISDNLKKRLINHGFKNKVESTHIDPLNGAFYIGKYGLSKY
jgi:N-acetylglucosamine kinase-like BadF-type ATPase